MSDLWKNVKVDPGLEKFIVVSGHAVQDLSRNAMRQPNPSVWLSERLNDIGRKRRDEHEAHNRKRRDEDRAFFEDRNRWPADACCVKEQPWVKANGRRFGHVFRDDFERGNFTVYVDGEASEVFSSLQELVEVWSVD